MKSFFIVFLFLLLSISPCYADIYITIVNLSKKTITLTSDVRTINKIPFGTAHLRFNATYPPYELRNKRSVIARAWITGAPVQKDFGGWILAEVPGTNRKCKVNFRQVLATIHHNYHVSFADDLSAYYCRLILMPKTKSKFTLVFTSSR